MSKISSKISPIRIARQQAKEKDSEWYTKVSVKQESKDRNISKLFNGLRNMSSHDGLQNLLKQDGAKISSLKAKKHLVNNSFSERLTFPFVKKIVLQSNKHEQSGIKTTVSSFLASTQSALICTILEYFCHFSFAAVIFSHEKMQQFIYLGFVANLVAYVVSNMVYGAFGTFNFGIISASSFDVPIMAGAIATVANHIEDETKMWPTAFIVVCGVSIVVGLIFMLLGRMKLLAWTNFIPTPVISGFLAGNGIALMKSAFEICTGKKWNLMTPAHYGPIFERHSVVLFLPCVLFGIIIAIGNLPSVKSKYPLAKPEVMFIVLFILSNAIFYIALAATEGTMEQAMDYGWMFQLSEQAKSGKWWSLYEISYTNLTHVDWKVAANAGFVPSLTTTIILVLGQAMRTAGISELTGVECNQSYDSVVIGSGNVLSGLFGGRTTIITDGSSILNSQLADRNSRVSTWMCAIVGICFLSVGHLVMAYAPKFICGGALFFLGLDTVNQTLVANFHKLPTSEFLTVVSVLAIHVLFDPMYGMSLGIFLTTGIFVVKYVQQSSESVIACIGTGKTYKSTQYRSMIQKKMLVALSGRILVANIQGYLFFGNTSIIIERLREFIVKQKKKQKNENNDIFLILSMDQVVGCDTTSINFLLQFTRQIHSLFNIHTICAGVNPTMYQQFNQHGLITQLPQFSSQDCTLLDTSTGHGAKTMSCFFGFKRWQLIELEKRFSIFDDGTGRIELSDSNLLSTVLSEFGINATVEQVDLIGKRMKHCYNKKEAGDLHIGNARINWIQIFFFALTATIADTDRDIMGEVRNTIKYVDSAFGDEDSALQWVENQLLSGFEGYMKTRQQQSVLVLLENSHLIMAEGGSRKHLKILSKLKAVSAFRNLEEKEKTGVALIPTSSTNTNGDDEQQNDYTIMDESKDDTATKIDKYDLFTQVVATMVMELELADRMVNGSVKEAIISLRERVDIETLKAGDLVFQTGKTVNRIVIILQGSLCVTTMLQQKNKLSPYRRMIRERVLVEGNMLGYTHFYWKHRPIARWDAHAVDNETVIASLKFSDLDMIHHDHSRLASFIHFIFLGDSCRDTTERFTRYSECDNKEENKSKRDEGPVKRKRSQQAQHRRKSSSA